MLSPVWSFYVDWVGDGLFAGAYDDITSRVRESQWACGRDYASQLTGRSIAGSCTLVLKNDDGRFNSFNASSVIYGKILPGRKIMIRAVYGGNTYNMWYGFLDSIEPQPAIGGQHLATLTGIGPLGYISQRKVNVAMKTTITTGAAVTEVLDQITWPVADRTIDTGQTTMNRWWTGGQLNALEALREMENTEYGFIRETADAKIAFEDRNHRYLGSHATAQSIYTDAAGSTIGFQEIQQEDPLRGIYNIIESEVTRYTVGDLAVLWTLAESGANSPSLDPWAAKTFWATYPNLSSAATGVGVAVWTTVEKTNDCLVNTQADGNGTDETEHLTIAVEKFDQSMKITLTNGMGSVVYLTFLQARGTPVLESDPVTIKREDTTSQGKYGERTYPIPGKFLPSSENADMYCSYVLSIYKDPIPVLNLICRANRTATQLVESLTRDISDRITITANTTSDLGINENFFIEHITHKVRPSGDWQVIYKCSNATAYTGAWILGLSALGTTTKLSF